MYAIYVNDTRKKIQGWFKGIRNKDCVDKYNGDRLIELTLKEEVSVCKTWKTEKAAIKYADKLKSMIKTVTYHPNASISHRYTHEMSCIIRVINLEKNCHIHHISCYRFDSDH